jgi:hypothetical protein
VGDDIGQSKGVGGDAVVGHLAGQVLVLQVALQLRQGHARGLLHGLDRITADGDLAQGRVERLPTRRNRQEIVGENPRLAIEQRCLLGVTHAARALGDDVAERNPSGAEELARPHLIVLAVGDVARVHGHRAVVVGPALHHPVRIAERQVLAHEVVGIFVEDDFVLAPAADGDGENVLVTAGVEARDALAHHRIDQVQGGVVGHEVDRQLARRGLVGGQAVQHAHQRVEVLELAGVTLERLLVAVTVDDETSRLSLQPARLRRTSKPRQRQRRHGGRRRPRNHTSENHFTRPRDRSVTVSRRARQSRAARGRRLTLLPNGARQGCERCLTRCSILFTR